MRSGSCDRFLPAATPLQCRSAMHFRKFWLHRPIAPIRWRTGREEAAAVEEPDQNMTSSKNFDTPASHHAPWTDQIYRALKDFGVRQVPYLPDGSLAPLIDLCREDSS